MTDLEEIKNILKTLVEKVETFEKTANKVKKPYNAWYKTNTGIIVYFTDETSGYGINPNGWTTSLSWAKLNEKNDQVIEWEPATEEEVKNMLIKEAIKRGFGKQGIKIKFIVGDSIGKTSYKHFSHHFEYEEGDLIIKHNLTRNTIFHNGTWAEIIEDDSILIDKYEVSFVNDPFRSGKLVAVINGITYSQSKFEAALTVIEAGGKVMVGCSHQFELTKETVDKILKKLNLN